MDRDLDWALNTGQSERIRKLVMTGRREPRTEVSDGVNRFCEPAARAGKVSFSLVRSSREDTGLTVVRKKGVRHAARPLKFPEIVAPARRSASRYLERVCDDLYARGRGATAARSIKRKPSRRDGEEGNASFGCTRAFSSDKTPVAIATGSRDCRSFGRARTAEGASIGRYCTAAKEVAENFATSARPRPRSQSGRAVGFPVA